jgi:hypothetical protein
MVPSPSRCPRPSSSPRIQRWPHRGFGSNPVSAAITARAAYSSCGRGDLATQHRALMPRHRDLHILRGITARLQRQPPQDKDHRQTPVGFG